MIGQTEDFTERVRQHDNNKKFWNKAIIFISIGGAMTKADVEYLEYKGYRLANKVKRYNLTENKQEPKRPHLPEHQQDAMDDFFEDCKFLTSFIGCNLFEEEKKEDATGQLTFYLCAPSYKNRSKRTEWVKKYAYEKNGELFLKSDYSFDSPSTASSYCLGCSSNGWTEWKTDDKRSLDSIFR